MFIFFSFLSFIVLKTTQTSFTVFQCSNTLWEFFHFSSESSFFTFLLLLLSSFVILYFFYHHPILFIFLCNHFFSFSSHRPENQSNCFTAPLHLYLSSTPPCTFHPSPLYNPLLFSPSSPPTAPFVSLLGSHFSHFLFHYPGNQANFLLPFSCMHTFSYSRLLSPKSSIHIFWLLLLHIFLCRCTGACFLSIFSSRHDPFQFYIYSSTSNKK